MGVKAIAQALDMVTSTCLHILRVLVTEELVKVDAAKRYSLGVGMLSLARSVIESNSFPAAVQPVLDRLSKQWSVTAIGVEIAGLEHMVVLALSQSKIPFRLHVDVGSRFPTLISATGRLVAAYSDRPWSEIERRFRSLRWQDPPAIDVWRKDLEKVRKKGYAIDRGNYINGVIVLAVPVFNARKQITHTLVAAGLADQLDNALCAAIAKDMQAEAGQLSAVLFSRA
jgi:DNA-binding IclR family transcriptional regulator